MMKKEIFKAYDIRGIPGSDFDEDGACALGHAVVQLMKARRVVVGQDARETSPAMMQALSSGIQETGAEVVDAGLVTTPMFYCAVASDASNDAGVMVTASHNPKEYNGFKIVRSGAVPVGSGSGMEDLCELVAKDVSFTPVGGGRTVGAVPSAGVYLKKIFSLIDANTIKPFKVAVDTGNGMAGVIIEKVFERTSVNIVKKLCFDVDMTFPNHEANPLKPETLVMLQDVVRKGGIDMGIAYDGDADRVGFVDEKGNIVPADAVIALVGTELVHQSNGGVILYDVRSSRMVAEEIEKAGGKARMCRVGHAFIKQHMKAENALFAGELSSHFYFKDFYSVECPDLAVLMLLQIMSTTGKTLSELVMPLMRYAHSGEINFHVDSKETIIKKLKEFYGSISGARVSEIDGVRIDFEDWWFSVRASNTEALLRLNVEGRTRELMEKQKRELSKMIGSNL